MGWKYVMIEATFGTTKRLFPIIFPDSLVHLEVATVMKLCGPLDGHEPRVVSAGNVDMLDLSNCSGKSTTLGLSSRSIDAHIIVNYDYEHGIIS
jgi:hypothetical protein